MLIVDRELSRLLCKHFAQIGLYNPVDITNIKK